jgi:hypothetical protein
LGKNLPDMHFSPIKGLITYACACYTDVLS